MELDQDDADGLLLLVQLHRQLLLLLEQVPESEETSCVVFVSNIVCLFHAPATVL